SRAPGGDRGLAAGALRRGTHLRHALPARRRVLRPRRRHRAHRARARARPGRGRRQRALHLGAARRHGRSPGARAGRSPGLFRAGHAMNRRRHHGAASVEFYIVSLLVLLPLVMAILQLGMLFVAKNTLNHATFMAARAASMANGSRGVMLNYLAKGLVPLY